MRVPGRMALFRSSFEAVARWRSRIAQFHIEVSPLGGGNTGVPGPQV